MPLPLILTAAALAPLALRGGRAALGLARARPAVAAAGVAGVGLAGLGAAQLPGILFGDEVRARRRRRKALTSEDMRTALTIASAISKKAAENFILQRTRR